MKSRSPKTAMLSLVSLCAWTTWAEAACLEDAATFALRICGELAQKGKSTLVTGSGDLSAEAKGILTRVLGSAGADFKTGAEYKTYEGLVQEGDGEVGDRQGLHQGTFVSHLPASGFRPVRMGQGGHRQRIDRLARRRLQRGRVLQ